MNPASHVHCVRRELPLGAELDAGQSVHATEPVTFLYESAAHGLQRPPSGPETPASHLQLVTVLLATAEDELAGHATQAAEPVTSL